MLTTLHNGGSRVSWLLRVALATGLVAVLALPLVDRSRAAADDDPQRAAAAEEAVEYLPLPSESEERILAALKSPTTLEFVEAPLNTVVQYLQSKHRIQVQLDNSALRDVGIDPEQIVTINVNDVRMDSALRLLLREMDLTYLILDEVLLITTQDRADNELLTLTYPVGDLVEGPHSTEKGGNYYDSLVDVITTTVRPQTWDEVGGPGTVCEVPSAKSLVISATRENHDEVLRLLRSLRAARKVSTNQPPSN